MRRDGNSMGRQGGAWEERPDPQALHEAQVLKLDISKARSLLGWARVGRFQKTCVRRRSARSRNISACEANDCDKRFGRPDAAITYTFNSLILQELFVHARMMASRLVRGLKDALMR